MMSNAAQVQQPDISLDYTWRLRITGTHNYAWAHGFVGGYPNFHFADYGEGLVHGTLLLNTNVAEWRDVPAADLGDPSPEDIAWRFSSTHDYAVRNGYASGFPNFHSADYGQGTVYGTILLQPGAAVWRDVFADVIILCAIFSFDGAITPQQVQRLLERHSFARSQVMRCGGLSNQEKHDLVNTYRRGIWHGVNNNPGDNASSVVGELNIWVNFTNLFPLGNNEIAQTLIHEMMHCAGYSHPDRCDAGTGCSPVDVPGDNGSYYGTAPLRAEICIAGTQSLTSAEVGYKCVGRNGRYTITSRD